jgi:hypothetical protein
LPDRVTSPGQCPDHQVVPDTVIRLLDRFNTFVPDFCQESIFRTERTDILNLPDTSSTVIKDEQSPAAVVAADFRTGLVYRATGFFTAGLVAEKRAGMGMFIKNAGIQKKVPFIGIDADGSFLTGIIVADQKMKIATIIIHGVDQPEVFTTFSALKTFERHEQPPH